MDNNQGTTVNVYYVGGLPPNKSILLAGRVYRTPKVGGSLAIPRTHLNMFMNRTKVAVTDANNRTTYHPAFTTDRNMAMRALEMLGEDGTKPLNPEPVVKQLTAEEVVAEMREKYSAEELAVMFGIVPAENAKPEDKKEDKEPEEAKEKPAASAKKGASK